MVGRLFRWRIRGICGEIADCRPTAGVADGIEQLGYLRAQASCTEYSVQRTAALGADPFIILYPVHCTLYSHSVLCTLPSPPNQPGKSAGFGRLP